MCFSPTASFTAAAVLGGIGILTLKETKYPNEVPLALFPLLFAIQQFIEGLLWLNLLHHGDWDTQLLLIGSYAFFAGVIWPIYVPVSISMLEPNPDSKRTMLLIALIGAALASYAGLVIWMQIYSAEIINNCIYYDFLTPPFSAVMQIAYVIAVCGPFFLSSRRWLRWIGGFNFIGFILANYFYHDFLTSVWCFYAAMLSGLIYLDFLFVRHHRQWQQPVLLFAHDFDRL